MNDEQKQQKEQDLHADSNNDHVKSGSTKTCFFRNAVLTIILLLTVFMVYREYQGTERRERGVIKNAQVVSVLEGEYTGSDADLQGSKYCVIIEYYSNFIKYTKKLYYKKDPGFNQGDKIRIKTDILDANDVISVMEN